jgi:hypothetical protein
MKRHLLGCYCCFATHFAKAQTTSIAEKLKTWLRIMAINFFYWDESTGKVWLQIDEFDKEFLYQTSLSWIRIKRYRNLIGGKIESILLWYDSTNFPTHTLQIDIRWKKRAVEQSFAQSTIWDLVLQLKPKVVYCWSPLLNEWCFKNQQCFTN